MNLTFEPVSPQINFPEMEQKILSWWYQKGIGKKYLEKNKNSKEKFSFLDGPITANNPMGVHHAWGRTYKDLWQKFNTMSGRCGRYQNGFDCQGLWVEVEVEKELGFKSKKDIESFGIANFVQKCKERVFKFAQIQTEQSKRLGYFMDWDNSYYTMSDENNYTIWHFLKTCWERNWIYKGHDSVPWCPRCETAISQHEMLTEDYKEVTHESIILKFPVVGCQNEYLLVWTTTPWTIPANIAVAVDANIEYSLVRGKSAESFWVAKALTAAVFKGDQVEIIKTVKGRELVGLKYTGPFDDLPAVSDVAAKNPLTFHTVIATDDLIMPISTTEGTGLVHSAVSAGSEDFKLGKKYGLPMIPVIEDNADYLPGLGFLSGKNAKKDPRIILDFLTQKGKDEISFVYSIFDYKHRYPACWRCKTELVWKIADEWYISMDRIDPTDEAKRTLREEMIEVVRNIQWLPSFGLDRELDWLKNMHDWMISKKNRYWGLALPIYECQKCKTFEVIGSKEELEKRAVSGWSEFSGNSPHRPWVDAVKIKCPNCASDVSRVEDVGNPWLDAGIVPFSTLPQDWFPADFITESFPGQFKNWFYSLIAMSTVLAKTNPFKTVLGFASMTDSQGRAFHKSLGNSIEFIEGADRFGADVIRWYCLRQSPYENIRFGQIEADETRRQFFLTLWNIYNFFITYAAIENYQPQSTSKENYTLSTLDNWILERLDQTVDTVTVSLEKFDSSRPAHAIEEFVSDLSLWYVRRSRARVSRATTDSRDKLACLHTFHYVLLTLAKIMAPFTPFLSETIYQNLVLGNKSFLEPSVSVHLESWPDSKVGINHALLEEMQNAREVVEEALSVRKQNQIKVRQPLSKLTYHLPRKLQNDIERLISDEVNVKSVSFQESTKLSVDLVLDLTPELVAEGQARELVRNIQDLRKKAGLKPDESVKVESPPWPEAFTEYIKTQALLSELKAGPVLRLV